MTAINATPKDTERQFIDALGPGGAYRLQRGLVTLAAGGMASRASAPGRLDRSLAGLRPMADRKDA